MKKLFVGTVVAVMALALLAGCSAPIQFAASVIGKMVASELERSSSTPLILGKELESYTVGEYVVVVSDGFYKSAPCIIFVAYKDGRNIQNLYYDKKNSEDAKMMNHFGQMDEVEKVQFIKDRFLKVARLNLDPVNPAEPETPKSTSKPSPDFPLPGFTPKP